MSKETVIPAAKCARYLLESSELNHEKTERLKVYSQLAIAEAIEKLAEAITNVEVFPAHVITTDGQLRVNVLMEQLGGS